MKKGIKEAVEWFFFSCGGHNRFYKIPYYRWPNDSAFFFAVWACYCENSHGDRWIPIFSPIGEITNSWASFGGGVISRGFKWLKLVIHIYDNCLVPTVPSVEENENFRSTVSLIFRLEISDSSGLLPVYLH